MKKTAVILMNLGGPACAEDIPPFLFSLFYDRAILTLPNPFRYLLAKIIARGRLPKAQAIYAQIGGGSPLLQNTLHQAEALEKELGEGYRVFIAMRHAPPFSEKTAADVKAYGPDKIVLLPLYPQYSTTTTESSLKAWRDATKEWVVPTCAVTHYPAQEGFLEAIQALILPAMKEARKYGVPRILFTAHGLPEKTIRGGDPYQSQVEETVRALVEKMRLSEEDLVLCYQSRVGPLKWIGPSLEEEIKRAASEKRPLVVVPISFVSEHSETLVELDITLRDLALSLGCPAYARVPTVQTHPAFIGGVVELVRGKYDIF